MTGTVLTEEAGDGVRVVTLNRPKALNALCDALVAELDGDRYPVLLRRWQAMTAVVLGIETSCDETGVAVFDPRRPGGEGLLAHIVYSQVDLHARPGRGSPQHPDRSPRPAASPAPPPASSPTRSTPRRRGESWRRLDADRRNLHALSYVVLHSHV